MLLRPRLLFHHGAHGGGFFSGKDQTKVDRPAAYAVRWVANSVVAAGLADRCLVRVSYVIGITEPLSIVVDTYGTGKKSDDEITEIVKRNFDIRPGLLIRILIINSISAVETNYETDYANNINPKSAS